MRYSDGTYVYFVREGLGGRWKVFKKPIGCDDYTKAHAYRAKPLEWRVKYDSAEFDLRRLANDKGWKVYEEE